MKRLIDGKGLTDPEGERVVPKFPTQRLLAKCKLVWTIAIHLVGRHEYERSVGTRPTRRFEQVQCADGIGVEIIKGDKQSIGYKRSILEYKYSNYRIPIEKGLKFYMYSDGVTSQLGGEKNLRFGSRRLKELLKGNANRLMEDQRKIIMQTLGEYRGKNERTDDLTMVGFGF